MWRLCKLGYRHEPRSDARRRSCCRCSRRCPTRCSRSGSSCSARACCRARPRLVRSPRRRRSACRRPPPGSCARSARACSAASATRSRSRSKSHVARLQASVATIAHHERPDYLDRLAMLRNQVFVLDHMYMSLFSTCGWILRLGVTVALLMSIHPALAAARRVRAADGAHVDVAAGGRARRRRSAARRPTGWRGTCSRRPPRRRPARKCASPASASGWSRERREAWERWYGPVAAARWGSAAWHTLAWAVFGAAYVGAVVFVSSGLGAPAGDVLLVLAAGSRLSAYIGATVGEIGFLRGFWMDGSQAPGLARGLRGVARRRRPTCRCRRGSRDGIRFEHVSFAYPGTDAPRARRCESRAAGRARSSRSSAKTARARRRS